MASEKIILITGASRGIGRGLTAAYLARNDTTVIAAVREPNKSTSKSLEELKTGKGSKLILVKIDSLVDTDAKHAVDALKREYDVVKLDLVIANAGDSRHLGPVTDMPLEELQYHFQVNTVGPFTLFQATWPLLHNASSPKFVVISSRVGSISAIPKSPLPMAGYGASKAAINYLIRKAHFENPSLITLSVFPGWTQTDLGNKGAAMIGRSEAPVPLEESLGGVIKEIDGAVRVEDTEFASYDHVSIGW